jgi:hypothetical protein
MTSDLGDLQWTPVPDPLADRAIWIKLVVDFTELPMNNGADPGGIKSLALAAGIDRRQATARVLTYYHHDASRGLQ